MQFVGSVGLELSMLHLLGQVGFHWSWMVWVACLAGEYGVNFGQQVRDYGRKAFYGQQNWGRDFTNPVGCQGLQWFRSVEGIACDCHFWIFSFHRIMDGRGSGNGRCPHRHCHHGLVDSIQCHAF